ncbi:MAG: aspartate dehydrogenase [Candidatus Hydrothermarchaeota archaeon]
MRIALIGCGSIGQAIASAVAQKRQPLELEIIFDADGERADSLAGRVGAKVAKSIEDILASDAEVVVEAASQEAVRTFAKGVLQGGKSLLVMSVGALADDDFRRELEEVARRKGVKIYLPSGAVGGLDALKGAALGGLDEVILITTKPPQGFRGNAYLARMGIDPDKVKEARVLYEGDARGAVEKFPANVNVAMTLSLAGIGAERTRVRVVVDPQTERNTHEVRVRGAFGEFAFRVDNVPSRENPRTSYLAALSAIATLKRIASPFQVGT